MLKNKSNPLVSKTEEEGVGKIR